MLKRIVLATEPIEGMKWDATTSPANPRAGRRAGTGNDAQDQYKMNDNMINLTLAMSTSTLHIDGQRKK